MVVGVTLLGYNWKRHLLSSRIHKKYNCVALTKVPYLPMHPNLNFVTETCNGGFVVLQLVMAYPESFAVLFTVSGRQKSRQKETENYIHP